MCRTRLVPSFTLSLSPSLTHDALDTCRQQPAILSGPVGAGKVYECSRNAIPGLVKFPVNRPGNLAGPVFTGAFVKQAPVP